MSKDPVVIVEALRTPMGSYLSSLTRLSATDLGAVVVRGTMFMTNLGPNDIDEVIMGCVLSAGAGQAPARQVVLKAGLSNETTATTVNKVCGSGMRAVMMAVNQILGGESEVVLAGGMESMSNAPLLVKRPGKKEEPDFSEYKDHLFWDGLYDAYKKGTPMGEFAEATAEKYKFSRKDQDDFTIESVKRAQNYMDSEGYIREVVPLSVKEGNEIKEINKDEPVERAKIEKIPDLKPVFKKEGTITAANASGITDGAAVLLLMRESVAKKYKLKPRAKIVAQTSVAREPEWFTVAPSKAIKSVLDKAGWAKKDVDLFEINEAFAVVPMAVMQDLGVSHDKVNVHGGACAMGHPIGASGARVLVTLLNALEQKKLKKGIASVCIGGGEATAMAIEVI
jgi:acetyl-CoA C-acetyltransferase